MTIRGSRPILLLAALLLGLLACTLPIDLGETLKEQIVSITEMKIEPPSSAGDFTLTMSYTRLSDKPVVISCYYNTPDKNTYAILVVEDDGTTPSGSITKTQAFSVVKSGGQAAEGLYTATCTDENGTSQQSTTFSVGADAAADVAILDMSVHGGQNDSFQVGLVYVINIADTVSFTCFYTSPDGATMAIGNFTDNHHLPGSPVVKTLVFSISPADRKANPGTQVYTATCQEDELRTSKTTSFTVTGETATVTTEPAKDQKTIFTRFHFDSATAVTNPPGLGGLVDEVIRDCIPTVKIFPDGTMDGLCEYSGATSIFTKANIWAKVTGTVKDAGKIDFLYEVQMYYPNGWKLTDVSDVTIWAEEWKYIVTIRGSGTLAADNSSSGTAIFDYSCDSGASNLLFCWKSQSKTAFSGNLSWTLVPEK